MLWIWLPADNSSKSLNWRKLWSFFSEWRGENQWLMAFLCTLENLDCGMVWFLNFFFSKRRFLVVFKKRQSCWCYRLMTWYVGSICSEKMYANVEVQIILSTCIEQVFFHLSFGLGSRENEKNFSIQVDKIICTLTQVYLFSVLTLPTYQLINL